MDPLAQLKDIHLPEQVHNYPIAPGWWILLALAVIAIILLVRFYLKYRQIRKIKKQIIAQVKHATTVDETLTLLKLAMMSYFPRKDTASLHSKPLHDFMNSQLQPEKSVQFDELVGDCLTECYAANANISVTQFNQAATFWLNHALPPAQSHRKLKCGASHD